MDADQKKTQIFVIGGAGAGIAFAAWAFSQDEGFDWWKAAFIAYLIVIPYAAWGMLKFRYRAMLIGNFLAATFLAFGFYAAHFAWTFWIFQEPTVTDRIMALFRPQVFLLLAGPALWFIHFSKESTRRLFA